MTARRFAVHVAAWWWRVTVGRILCRLQLHAWNDSGVGNRPSCSRCPHVA